MRGDDGRPAWSAKHTPVRAQQEWTRAWSGRYGHKASGRLRPSGQSPAKLAVLFGALLGLLVAPLAIAQGSGSGADPQATAARTGDVLREGLRNPRRGFARRETQVISAVTGERYGTRQSNAGRGPNAGGAAIYGCRRPTRECTRHVNLAGGPAAHFSAQGDGAVPFTVDPNATGLVESLNAELLQGMTPAQIAALPSPPTGPAGGDLTGNYPNPTIANDAVTTEKLADNSVNSAKLAPAIIVAGALQPFPANAVATRNQSCPAGHTILSGGLTNSNDNLIVLGSRPLSRFTWTVSARNNGALINRRIRVLCMP